jgi:hypothetical protein
LKSFLDISNIIQNDSYIYIMMIKKQIKCERCGENLKSIKWLELSQTDGNYYVDIPKGHISQGSFSFGTSCATAQINETILKLKS